VKTFLRLCARAGLLAAVAAASGAVCGGCATPLRAPLCSEGEFEFPAGAEGRYRMAVPQSSVRWSGAMAQIDEIEFAIREGVAAYQIETTKGALDAVAKAGSSRRGPPVTIDEPAPGPGGTQAVLPLAVCRIGDAYYSQTDEGDGTWTIARFDLSATGITTVGLSFVPEELAAAGFRYALIPRFQDVDEDGEWSFDMMEPIQLVVDTRDLTAAARERLVALGHPTVMGMVFSRIGEAPSPTRRDEPSSRGKRVVFGLKRRPRG
jgi:hypothetical protein